jgi:hypothetical protein
LQFHDRAVCFLIGCALAAAFGCGNSDRPDTLPASGTVRYRGAPLADAQVTFIPTEGQGRQATAATDAEGKFHLGTYAEGDGALSGKHQVTISKAMPEAGASDSPYPALKSVIPSTYSSPLTSPLVAEVKEGDNNEFLFELAD